LLVGPYDPKGGEYTFLAPPLGVWRLAGVLKARGIPVEVFDPNCCSEIPEAALIALIRRQRWDVVGISTTGMTLQYDLALAHLAKRLQPHALFIAGGMEATFNAAKVLELGPFDLVVLGEGEEPLLDVVARLQAGANCRGIAGTAWRSTHGEVQRAHRPALTRDALKQSIFKIPYEEMPYRRYWHRLEHSLFVGGLPVKAEREARFAETRSVRLITLNYCPMGCTFCSSTNFLNVAQDGTARIARLDAEECLQMIRRIVSAQPRVRTVIFQDDIFVFRRDDRILALCDAIVRAKGRGELPAGLQFISTNRIDAMTPERLAAMHGAGFRVLGFGIESFSPDILREFNKAQIAPYVEPMLTEALRLGITPFLDMILTSPQCRLADLATNIRQAFRWVRAGCEVGMYPYVVPFSGAALAADAGLLPTTIFESRYIAGTRLVWQQAAKILPADAAVREAILRIESRFDRWVREIQREAVHVPSRVRSLGWILNAVRVLDHRQHRLPSPSQVARLIAAKVPGVSGRFAGRDDTISAFAAPQLKPRRAAVSTAVEAPAR
jgi:radical SAM superfamily enzyme YgiQ (UPF0313 family)